MTIKDDAARDDTRISGRNRASGARTFPDFHLLAGLGTAGSPVSNDEPVAGKTLFKALQHCKSTEDMWPRLFHLSVFLRYGHSCDSKILPAPNCRSQSKKLNWQQLGEREAALINKQLRLLNREPPARDKGMLFLHYQPAAGRHDEWAQRWLHEARQLQDFEGRYYYGMAQKFRQRVILHCAVSRCSLTRGKRRDRARCMMPATRLWTTSCSQRACPSLQSGPV